MTIKELTAALGIETYPANMENYSSTAVDICDTEMIRSLEEKYGLLKEYADFALQGAEALKKDPLRHAWGNLYADYLMNCPHSEREKPSFLQGDDLAADALHLLILLSLIPAAIKRYQERGFETETVLELFRTLPRLIKTVEERNGRPFMNRSYFGWMLHYTDSLLFRLGIFNFELSTYKGEALFLKNRNSGEGIPLLTGGIFHTSGMPLGSEFCEDEEGAFEAPFRETDEGWEGYAAENGQVVPRLRFFPKTEWECILKAGEDVLSVHIPKGVDFSPENIDESLRMGLAFAKEKYPDFNVKCLYCSSWLLDPTLKEILGEGSKIVGFQNRFIRYPKKTDCSAVFSFAFQMNRPEDLNTLPENSRLQRGIKERLLRGEGLYSVTGIILP